MSSGFFTNAEDDAMIARIRENAVLYDASHSMYKDVMHKDYIWHQIGTAVGRTPEDCKKRWKNIKDTYKRHKKKSQAPSAMASQSPQKKKWHLMNQLSFLDPFFEKNVRNSGIAAAKAEEAVDDETDDDDDDDDDKDDDNDDDVTAVRPDVLPSTPSSYRSNGKRRGPVAAAGAGAKTAKVCDAAGVTAALNGILEQNAQLLAGGRTAVNAPDSVDLFFNSVALNVKKLPARAINKAQMKILALVAQLEDEYSHPVPFLHRLPSANYNRYTNFRRDRSTSPSHIRRNDDEQSPFGLPRYVFPIDELYDGAAYDNGGGNANAGGNRNDDNNCKPK